MDYGGSDIYKDTQQVTMPWQEVYSVANSVVIDSRQRDCARYRTPSRYVINLDNTFKNITSIELKGAIIPKSSYNIHSSNNKIDFAIGSTVTEIRIIDGGSGYVIAPTVTITSPPSGTTATATAIINMYGSITNIIINVTGSGYIPSTPPSVFISAPTNAKQARLPRALAIVGTHYTAQLRIGEYDIGGNPIPPSFLPTNLLLEIQNAMNYVVIGGAYNPLSSSPFVVRLVSQYPEIGATTGTPEAFDTNSCLFNRIQVVNVNSDPWEFLWSSGPNKIISMASVMGYNTVDTGMSVATAAVVTMTGTLIPTGTSLRGHFDYNLKNDPDYIVMSIGVNNINMDRLKSPDDGLEDTFAIILFDNNNPETLHDLSVSSMGSITSVGGVQYLQGPTGKGLFWRDAGAVKPIKGYDFDMKKLSFKPPISSVNNLTIQFTKFGYKPGGSPLFYDMEGREHLLLFEFTATDNRSQMKS
jgi:hypothetical protein